ncbi:hypothetical protein [Nocardia abscessus]|uniref:hypothetical protein n=1 Tax=Nocardia abscessus TaxID=120957 RepID=UPI001E38F2CF|nr:hypothetical protein [Nocardia abscessus]
MRYRNRYDTDHHAIAHHISHIHHPHAADNYCRTTASGHAALDHRFYPAANCGHT